MKKVTIDFIVRTMHKSDMRYVLAIEKMTSSFPWNEKDFTEVANSVRDFCLVATLPGTHGDEVIGHLVLRCDKDDEILAYLRIGVNPEWQRCGVAKGMIGVARKHAGFFKSERAFAEGDSPPHMMLWQSLGFVKDREIDGPAPGIVYALRR